MMRQLLTGLSICLLLLAGGVGAHHSRANFLFDQTVTVSGRIKEFTFRSPHAWIVIETRDEDGNVFDYTVEGGSVGSLRRFGWSKDSLATGENVTVVGNPDRRPEKHLMYLSSVAKADGTVLVVTGEPAVAAKGKQADIAPSTDFGGIWTRVATEEYFNVGAFNPPTHWPLNDRGREQVAAFTMRDDPLIKCIPPALPRLSYSPFRHRWTRTGDVLTIEKELSPYKRTIRLGEREWPESIEPSRMGYSIGWIDGDGALNIETKGFVADKWGNYRGLDSSIAKFVRERYVLTNGGLGMQLELTVEDPEYLSGPYTETWNYVKGPDFNGDLAKQDCDPESSSYHLRFEEQ